MKATETLIKYINNCIANRQSLDFEDFTKILNKQNLESKDRLFILSLYSNHGNNLTKMNREIYDYFYNREESEKYAKRQEKFNRNNEDQAALEESYKQYENYVYSLVSTKNYKSRMNKTQKKINLLTIENLFGHDQDQSLKDVFQEAKMFIWEGLKKFGVLPEKAKNWKDAEGVGRMEKGHQRNLSGKSTFVHQNLSNSLINLSIRASSDKFTHQPVEYSAETFGERDEDE